MSVAATGGVAPARRGASLGLYVHLPWCVKKCPYCDFNSHGLRGGALPAARYTDALCRDLAAEAADRAGDNRRLTSVFFGGGTPSLFPAASIAKLLDLSRALFGIASDAEVTLEANPGTVEYGRFDEYKSAGVNRISLGAQSFAEGALRALGRIHGAADIRRAYERIRAAGFDNVNLDIMYGLPGQTAAAALADIDAALDLAPEHISHYQLTLEPNTLFHASPPSVPDADTCWRMQSATSKRLAAAGFVHYEVSAHARAGREAGHNLNYWHFGDYLGVGAGAHGKTSVPGQRVSRTAKERHPRRYMERAEGGLPLGESRVLTRADLGFEYPLNLLRLKDETLDLGHYEAATGAPAATLAAGLAAAEARGLLARSRPGRWRKTELGWRFLNDLQALFLQSDSV